MCMADTDLTGIDLNLLRVFQVIFEERSLTRTGQRLRLTQPAISYALGRLRSLFDDPLFVRATEGMLPTPTAEQLALPIGRAIASIREALSYGARFDPATSTREFRISMTDVAQQVFLPLICEKLQPVAPSIRLEACQVPISEIVEALRLGQVDFATGNLPKLTGFTNYQVLFRERYVCMTRRRPNLPGGQLTRQQFLDFSHISVVSSEGSHRIIDESLAAAGVLRRIALRVRNFTVLPQILERTDLMATLPERIACYFNRVDLFKIYALPVEIPEIDVRVHWHESFDNDEGNRWFRNSIIGEVGLILANEMILLGRNGSQEA